MPLPEPWFETLHIQSAIFLIMAQPNTNCDFRTFSVKESFWGKKQNCITLKISLWKLLVSIFCFCLFQWTSLYLGWIYKKGQNSKFFIEFLHVFQTFSHIISKIWKSTMLLSFPSQNSQCVWNWVTYLII